MLTKINQTNYSDILEIRNHPNVRLKMFDTKVITRDQHDAWWQKIARDTSQCWQIFSKTGFSRIPIVGVVYFTKIDKSLMSAFWGFYLNPIVTENPLEATVWARRLFVEVFAYARETLQLNFLEAETRADNHFVIFMNESFGVEKSGILCKHVGSVDLNYVYFKKKL